MSEPQQSTLPKHEFEAGGKNWRITALGSKVGLATLTKLANILGPAIAQLDRGAAGAAAAAGVLFARMTVAQTQDLVDTFLKSTEVEREHGFVRWEKLGFLKDELFAADYGTLLLVLAQHLELNYTNFLGAVRDIAPQFFPDENAAAMSQDQSEEASS
jgi:hypothetical protein